MIHKILDGIYKKMNMPEGRKIYYLCYTFCFILMSFGVFIWFLCGRNTFIWHADGWSQHYKALVYYAQYLREIVRNIVTEHQIMIPNWDFNIGEGADVLQTLHYYVIGEPITVLAMFVPARFIHIFYDISVLARIYLAGLTFSWFCFEMKNQNRYAVLAGSMVYVFSYWAIYSIAMHPYFLTPMIYLPLLLLGVEKIIRKEKIFFFSGVVFLSAISNFYFFYMLVIMTIIYVGVRLCFLNEQNLKERAITLGKIGVGSLFGVGLSSVILLPMCVAFLNNSRMGGTDVIQRLLYPLSYYSRLIGMFLTKDTEYSLFLGFAAPSLVAVFYLFMRKKENKQVKIFLCIGILFMMLPVFGQALNGFAYVSNRWCFAFAMVIAYIVTKMFPYLMDINKRECIILFKLVTVYFIICMLLEYSRNIYVFYSIILCYIFIGILLPIAENKISINVKWKNGAALGMILFSILSMGFWRFSSAENAGNVAAEGVESQMADYDDLKMNEASALKNFLGRANTESFRYTGRNLTENAGMLSEISSTQFYWSLSSPYFTEYRNKLGLPDMQSFRYTGYDDREFLMSLASVLYYLTPVYDVNNLPQGFSHIATMNVKDSITCETQELLKQELQVEELTERQYREIEGMTASWLSIYMNDNALPLAYTYDKYIPEKEWDKLSMTERQEALISTVVLEETPNNVKVATPELLSKEISYDMMCNNDEVSIRGNTFVVTAPSAQITLNFNGLQNSETYFQIDGLEFEGVTDYDLYLGADCFDPYQIYNRTNWELLSHAEQQKMKRQHLFWKEPDSVTINMQTSLGKAKTLTYATPEFAWYQNRHDFLVSFSYTEEPINSITLTFSQRGIYSFDDIKIYCQPMEQFGERVRELQTCTLNNLVVGNDEVSGKIIADEPKMLCFSIPYADGWCAYVDGKPTKLYQANIAYMAMEIMEGEHEVKLCYETPLLKEGIYISISTTFVLAIVWLWQRSKKKVEKVNSTE